MGIAAARVTVTTTATSLMASPDVDGTYGGTITVQNRGAVSVFIGGSTVTVSTGFELEAGSITDGVLVPGDALYGVTASGTAACSVLQTGV